MRVEKQIGVSLGIALSILLVSFGVLAWTGPTATPTDDNIPAPLNVSSDTQHKSGSLHIGDSVGIGTQSPSERLEVDGRIRVGSGPIHSMDAVTKGYIDDRVEGVGEGAESLSELNIDVSKNWGGYRIRGLSTPSFSSDIATKGYVNAELEGCLDSDEYALTINTSGSGTTNPSSGTHYYSDGTSVTVTASPSSGWEFSHWSGDCSGGSCSLTMTENKSVTANFNETEEDTYSLTISTSGSGTTNPSSGTHYYSDGTSVTVTANPSSGWEFSHWSGDCSGGSCSLTMTENKSVTANFSEEETLTWDFNFMGEDASHWTSSTNTTDGEDRVWVRHQRSEFSGSVQRLNQWADRDHSGTGRSVRCRLAGDCPASLSHGGQTYQIEQIGNHCWMAENLNYSGHSSGYSACYNNSSSNCNTYGRLYSFEAAQTACPSGWTLPTDSNWKVLEATLGMPHGCSCTNCDCVTYPGSGDGRLDDEGARWEGDVGTQLRSTSWDGDNSSGLNFLPGGYASWSYE